MDWPLSVRHIFSLNRFRPFRVKHREFNSITAVDIGNGGVQMEISCILFYCDLHKIIFRMCALSMNAHAKRTHLMNVAFSSFNYFNDLYFMRCKQSITTKRF